MKLPSLNAEMIHGSKQSKWQHYLDPGRSIRTNVNPEDRISLEKLIGKGERKSPPPPPFSFQLPRLYTLFE